MNSMNLTPRPPTFVEEEHRVYYWFPVPSGRIQCPLNCGASFQHTRKLKNADIINFQGIQTHLAKKHSGDVIQSASFVCTGCDRHLHPSDFNTGPKQHVCSSSKRDAEQQFKCTFEGCPKTFFRRSAMLSHLRAHFTDKVELSSVLPKRKKSNASVHLSHQSDRKSESKPSTSQKSADAKSDDEDNDESVEDVEVFEEMEVEDESWPTNVVPSTLLKPTSIRIRSLHRLTVNKNVWETFCTELDKSVELIQEWFNLKPDDKSNLIKRDIDLNNPSVIRRLYSNNRKLAMRKIFSEKDTKEMEFSVEELQNHVMKKNAPVQALIQNDIFLPVLAGNGTKIQKIFFTKKVILKRLRGFANTAPGDDKIQYRHLLLADPDCSFLENVFTMCRKYRRIPDSWKRLRGFLIPKANSDTSPEGWRIIYLSSTMYRLYSALVSDGLRNLVSGLSVPANWRQFIQDGNVGDYQCILEMEKAKALSSQSQMCAAFLDIKDAYPSLHTNYVLEALRTLKIHSDDMTVIKNMLNEKTAKIITRKGSTTEIRLKNVLTTGDPISCVLFSIVTGLIYAQAFEWSKDWDCPENASPLKRYPNWILNYQDDVAITSKKPENLQRTLDYIHGKFSKIQLEMQNEKCCSLYISGKGRIGTRAVRFKYGTALLRSLEDHQYHEFLGIRFGYGSFEKKHFLSENLRKAAKIYASNLSPWQKLEALSLFVFSSVNYQLLCGNATAMECDRFDREVKHLIKTGLRLEHNGSPLYLYGSRRLGCLGVNSIVDDYRLQWVARGYSLLTSSNDRIKEMASQSLLEAIVPGLTSKPSPQTFVDFLNGDLQIEIKGTYWIRVRHCSKMLKLKWALDHRNQVFFRLKNETNIIPSKYDSIIKTLRKYIREDKAKELQNPEKNQTASSKMSCVALSKISSAFISDFQQINEHDFYFIHKARLGLTPVRGANCFRSETSYDRSCRKCPRNLDNPNIETIFHVLSECEPNLDYFTKRHDAILDELECLVKNCGWTILHRDQILDVSDSALRSLRPDLVIRKGTEGMLLDVTCPGEVYKESMELAASKKIEKYQKLAEVWKDGTPYITDVCVGPIVVGTLGSWYPDNQIYLDKLKCSKKKIETFAKKCVALAIHWSQLIMTAHLKDLRIDMVDKVPKLVDKKQPRHGEPMQIS